MARFLTTIPNNLGYVNLGKVQAYPTGGTGPTAYGPTTYFGSDPLPPRYGDNLNSPIDLGDFSPLFREVNVSGTHGGLTRRTSTFYKLRLNKKRSLQVVQNYSQTALTKKTNRNTLIAFYKLVDGTARKELPINDSGYVVAEASINVGEESLVVRDYTSTMLETGVYIFVITNDFRYLDTQFSITIKGYDTDWHASATGNDEKLDMSSVDDAQDWASVTAAAEELIDFGKVLED